jgi:hypothetical protein
MFSSAFLFDPFSTLSWHSNLGITSCMLGNKPFYSSLLDRMVIYHSKLPVPEASACMDSIRKYNKLIHVLQRSNTSSSGHGLFRLF